MVPKYRSLIGRSQAAVWTPALCALYTAMYVGLLFAFRKAIDVPGSGPEFWSTALYVPFELVAGIMCWTASRREGIDSRTRAAWILIAASYVGPILVNIAWVHYVTIGKVSGFPWPMYAAVYTHYALALWGLTCFPRAPRHGAERATFLMDAGIVAVAGAAMSWHFLFRVVLGKSGAGPLAVLYTLSYPVASLTLVFGAAAVLVRRPLPMSKLALRLLLSSYLFGACADVLFARARVLQLNLLGATLNSCYAVAAMLAVFAGAAQLLSRTSARSRTAGDRQQENSLSAPSGLPYLAIAAVYVVLLYEVVRPIVAPGSATFAEMHSSHPVLVLSSMLVTGIVIMRQIIAQRRNVALATERLAREVYFGALVRHASDVFLVLDANGNIREASPAVTRVLGHEPDALFGRSLCDLAHPDDAEVVHADLSQATSVTFADGRMSSLMPCEWRIRHADGSVRWVEALCTNLIEDPAVRGLVVNARDVSERKALEAELTHRAYHDPLTGLSNRARFRRVVADALERVANASRIDHNGDVRGIALLYVDLDGFKPVNDSRGHAAGDRVLEVVSARLRDATRGSDTVARLGGDEFAVMLGRVRTAEDAIIVADRIISTLAEPILMEHGSVSVGASVGIACAYPPQSEDPHDGVADPRPTREAADTLLRMADHAMYRAKSAGGGRYVVIGTDTRAMHTDDYPIVEIPDIAASA